jgi:hypothetical protein
MDHWKFSSRHILAIMGYLVNALEGENEINVLKVRFYLQEGNRISITKIGDVYRNNRCLFRDKDGPYKRILDATYCVI